MNDYAESGSDNTSHLLLLQQALTSLYRRSRTFSPAPCDRQSLLKCLRRRRTNVILATACIAALAVGSAKLGEHVMGHLEAHATVTPLAPAPAPPAPPAIASTPKPHLLRRLPFHPLSGFASWYGSMWNGHRTASGETYDETQLTAAHRSLPLGSLVRVTNLRSMRSVIVRINDRGAFAPTRIIDLSSAAARQIGMVEQGLAQVKLEILGKH